MYILVNTQTVHNGSIFIPAQVKGGALAKIRGHFLLKAVSTNVHIVRIV